jgi:hypothetical protein
VQNIQQVIRIVRNLVVKYRFAPKKVESTDKALFFLHAFSNALVSPNSTLSFEDFLKKPFGLQLFGFLHLLVEIKRRKEG